jgi:hypothetical protein
MKRRTFLAACLSLLPCSAALAAHRKRFVFEIKTKSGGIVGNVVVEAKDMEEAKYKLRQRYPDCEILEGHEDKRGGSHLPASPHSVTSIGLPLSFGPRPRRNGTAFSAHAAGSG